MKYTQIAGTVIVAILSLFVGYSVSEIYEWRLGALAGLALFLYYLWLLFLLMFLQYKRKMEKMWPHYPDPYWGTENAVWDGEKWEIVPPTDELEGVVYEYIPEDERDKLQSGTFEVGEQV